MKYALVSPDQDPAPVLGWIDGDFMPDNPPGVLVEITDGEWDARTDGHMRSIGSGKVIVHPLPDALPPLIHKSLITSRVAEAGKLRALLEALGQDKPLADLTDDELHTRERWNSNQSISAADLGVRSVITAAGMDPDVILSPG